MNVQLKARNSSAKFRNVNCIRWIIEWQRVFPFGRSLFVRLLVRPLVCIWGFFEIIEGFSLHQCVCACVCAYAAPCPCTGDASLNKESILINPRLKQDAIVCRRANIKTIRYRIDGNAKQTQSKFKCRNEHLLLWQRQIRNDLDDAAAIAGVAVLDWASTTTAMDQRRVGFFLFLLKASSSHYCYSQIHHRAACTHTGTHAIAHTHTHTVTPTHCKRVCCCHCDNRMLNTKKSTKNIQILVLLGMNPAYYRDCCCRCCFCANDDYNNNDDWCADADVVGCLVSSSPCCDIAELMLNAECTHACNKL